MKRFFMPLTLLALALPALAFAQAPKTMSYQGVLTDNGGALLPDGSYNLTFRIYDVPVAGVALFTENHPAVALSKGGFSVILGSINPMSLPFDGPYYLGVQVAADPELAPRVPLAASPYALGLALPFRASAVAGTPLIIGSVFAGGGAFYTADNTGSTTFNLEPDVDGGGAQWLYMLGAGGFLNFDGNAGGAGTPLVILGGTASNVVMDTRVIGDPSIRLPDDAINALEVLDEPGIAQAHVNGDLVVPAAMGDLVRVTINTPAAGYIVVEADGQHRLSGNGANANVADFQIDETMGGGLDGDHYFASGYNAATPNGTTWHPLSIRRTYFKAAGSYTFRLEGFVASNPLGGTNNLWNATITATYYPTAYGSVIAAPPVAEAGSFENVTRTHSGSADQPGGDGILVDLRELELKATRARAAAAQAEVELIKARARQQASTTTTPR